MSRSPYQIIKKLHVTEKSMMQSELQHSNSTRAVAKCQKPKYVFVVDQGANKYQIKLAFQEIYKNVSVKSVHTILRKAKPTRRKRFGGGHGKKSSFKLAIVTLAPGESIEEV